VIKTENRNTEAHGELDEILTDLADIISTVRYVMARANVSKEESAQFLAMAIALGIGGQDEENDETPVLFTQRAP
jgi:hypothetical protein